MKVHELKIKEVYYERIISGSKDFEIRFNDRDYQVNDELLLVPIDRNSLVVDRTPIRAKIKYIHSGLGMAEGYVALGLDWEVTT